MIDIKLIEQILNERLDRIPAVAGTQQRGVGDIVEYHIHHIISKEFEQVEYATSKRSMEDFQIVDGDQTYKFDVKTHDVNAKFSMPNLVSVKRLKKYLANPLNHLCYIIVQYELEDRFIVVKGVKVFKIEHLDWNCLAIQNLGKGQLQIVNANNITLNESNDRDVWVNTLVENTKTFYLKQIESLKKEIACL